MQTTQIVIVIAALIAIMGVGALAWVFMTLPGNRQREVRGMMASMRSAGSPAMRAAAGDKTVDDEELASEVERIKKISGSSSGKRSGGDNIETKLFKAGLYSENARKKFAKFRIFLPIVLTPILYLFMYSFVGKPGLAMLVGSLGIFIGIIAPGAWLDREIRKREEDVMYFLPLVIEQVSIGVSSALDVGPCLAQILAMADERDSHNPVTEMLVHVEKLIRSGLNLEDALFEVGEISGMTEVKHAFMFLAQCAKHGGEVSRQLQELADAVMVQRQVQVEGRITALPVKATGPLAMVFAGFFMLILAGLVIKLLGAFGPTG
jgi:Flp pilus assembly protein TadB